MAFLGDKCHLLWRLSELPSADTRFSLALWHFPAQACLPEAPTHRSCYLRFREEGAGTAGRGSGSSICFKCAPLGVSANLSVSLLQSRHLDSISSSPQTL